MIIKNTSTTFHLECPLSQKQHDLLRSALELDLRGFDYTRLSSQEVQDMNHIASLMSIKDVNIYLSYRYKTLMNRIGLFITLYSENRILESKEISLDQFMSGKPISVLNPATGDCYSVSFVYQPNQYLKTDLSDFEGVITSLETELAEKNQINCPRCGANLIGRGNVTRFIVQYFEVNEDGSYKMYDSEVTAPFQCADCGVEFDIKEDFNELV